MQRLRLANLPTPIEHAERLGQALGIDLWIKRDDATAGPESGNKIRKLEYLLADALAQDADVLITCGGAQSNHARATALLAARLGLRAVLFLRDEELTEDADGRGPGPGASGQALQGNLLLDRLAGAELRFITAESYGRRDTLMLAEAARLREGGARPYVIAEGGSNGLGALGYVHAMAEIRDQLDAGAALGQPFDLIVHACGSGGTAAGVALGSSRYGVASRLCAMAVCDDAETFTLRIQAIIDEARQLDAMLQEPADWQVDDRAKGQAYGVSSPEQRRYMVEVARLSGLVLDPVYTGKAMFGLRQLCDGQAMAGQRVLFIHTGGLPGLMAQASTFLSDV